MSRTCMTTPQIRSSAQRAPGCNRSSSRAVLEGHPAFFFLGDAAASVEAASLEHPANSKRCSWWLQHVLATAAAQPQNRLENLNSGELASPTPSITDPEWCYTRLIAGSVALSKLGRAWRKYKGGLPAHSLWRQSQEHCCPGSIFTRAAAAEDGGALGSLCEVIPHARTSAARTWETARAQIRGVEFTGSLRQNAQNTLWPASENTD